MEEKNTPKNEQNDKKSWLEEQLQKRNVTLSEETFTFKEDKNTNTVQNTDENTKTDNTIIPETTDTTVVKAENNENLPIEENITVSEDAKNAEKEIVLSAETHINLVTEENKEQNTEISKPEQTPPVQNKTEPKQEPVQNEVKTSKSVTQPKWFQKLSQIGQKKLWGEVTVKKAVPYTFGGIILLFLLFNIRYLVFNENKVPSLHNVNVKDTVLSDMSVTKVLDPNTPDKNDTKKNTKKQDKPTNNNEKQDKTEKITERVYYRVKSGDKFNDIARKHGLTPAELKELNPKVRPERIQPGQKLRVKKLD
jgi:LysM repeat protein